MSPRSEALAFRIWQHCQDIGWDCTVEQAAQALGESVGRARRIVQLKGWGSRFRSARLDYSHDRFIDEVVGNV